MGWRQSKNTYNTTACGVIELKMQRTELRRLHLFLHDIPEVQDSVDSIVLKD